VLNNFNLEIDFEFGLIDGRFMTLIANQLVVDPSSPSCSIPVTLPGQVKLIFSGKNNSRDTKINEQGQIIADMYIKILAIRVDKMLLSDWIMHKKLTLIKPDGQTLITSYIGFNGEMIIDMPESNAFAQYQKFCRRE
jgi:hypothetical protein